MLYIYCITVYAFYYWGYLILTHVSTFLKGKFNTLVIFYVVEVWSVLGEKNKNWFQAKKTIKNIFTYIIYLSDFPTEKWKIQL